MSARHLDPIVWAAAYGAAFVHLYAEERGATDVQPGFMSRRTVALERVHAPAAVEIADAAVLALHPEARGKTPETAKARDAAWARLAKAVETRWREDFLGAAQCDYQREIEAAKDALRALGVDEDLLRLGEP